MSTKKTTVSDKNKKQLIDRLKAVKKLGFLPELKVNQAGNFTKAQKAKVAKKVKELTPVLTARKDNFKKIDISKYNAADKAAIKRAGFLIVDDKAFITSEDSDKVTIKKQYVNDKNTGLRRNLIITRKDNSGKTTQTLLPSVGEKELDWEKRLRQEASDLKIKKGEFLALNFYSNGIFQRQLLTDLNVGIKYLQEEFTPHDGDPKNVLLDNVHVSKTTISEFRQLQDVRKADKNRQANINASRRGKKKFLGRISNAKKKK